MADRSAIEWTDASWNPVRARNLKTGKIGWHCEHATTGCINCYSEGFNRRLGTGLDFKPGHRKDIELFLDENMLTLPLRWKKPRMIFVCSTTDLFADFVPDEWIDKMFAVMALAPQHTFQVLTKRAARMREYLSDGGIRDRVLMVAWKTCSDLELAADVPDWPLPNVWPGVSAEQQQEADERIPHLLLTPAAVRFVSAEPLVGPLNLAPWLAIIENDPNDPRMVFDELVVADGIDFEQLTLDWVIVGGESGPAARPMHPAWARSLRDQCAAAGVPFFFKQHGQFAHQSQQHHAGFRSDQVYQWDDTSLSFPVGKKAAGRLLDGVEHNGFPKVGA